MLLGACSRTNDPWWLRSHELFQESLFDFHADLRNELVWLRQAWLMA